MFVALFEKRILSQDFTQAFRVRIHEAQIFAAAAGGLALRRFHGIEHGIEQIERQHHEDTPERVRALQLPGDRLRKLFRLCRTLLRIDAVRFHILAQWNLVQRVRIRIGIGEMRPFHGVRIREDDLRAYFLRAADGFNERIGRLDRHIHGLLGLGLMSARRIVIENNRNLRQPPHRFEIKLLERNRQLYRDDLRTCGKNARRRTSAANSRRPGTTGR